jgi:hypothetical protein
MSTPARTQQLVTLAVAIVTATAACHHSAPSIRFAPDGTSVDRLRAEFALSAAERQSLTPDTLRLFTQAQLDQIYVRLSTGPMPDGPFRGDLFFPRGSAKPGHLSDLAPNLPARLSAAGAMPLEQLGRALWRGKVFFKADGILRNRIEDLLILKPFIKDSASIPKLTFDGQTTWLLFPAKTSCGPSKLDPAHHAIVIDYSKGSEVTGYREIPDSLAGPDALDILDEVRLVRPGLYLGRAHFRGQFRLNFTLLKPDAPPSTGSESDLTGDCTG